MSEDIKVAKDSIEDSTVEGVRSLEADKYKYCLLYTSDAADE